MAVSHLYKETDGQICGDHTTANQLIFPHHTVNGVGIIKMTEKEPMIESWETELIYY